MNLTCVNYFHKYRTRELFAKEMAEAEVQIRISKAERDAAKNAQASMAIEMEETLKDIFAGCIMIPSAKDKAEKLLSRLESVYDD